MNDRDQTLNFANEPFNEGRAASRLLFDLGIMISCFKEGAENRKVMDFGTGTGWIAEWLNRMGYEVIAFDINKDLPRVAKVRIACDSRVNPRCLHFQCADGHEMPFKSGIFSHICCFDSLHHMTNYPKVFAEFYRLLVQGGRAIFVEPGAAHSISKSTVEFIEKYKKDDPTWIERDVVLEEIYQIAMGCGFSQMKIRALLFPDLSEYDFPTWQEFRNGNPALEAEYLKRLKTFNYESRVVFYLEKGPKRNREEKLHLPKHWLKGKIRSLIWKFIKWLR